MALLAARIAGVRVMTVGTGWTLPPATVPLPSIQPWSDISPDMLTAAEARALGPLNAALVGFGARPLASLAELFEARAISLLLPRTGSFRRTARRRLLRRDYQTEKGVEPEWPTAAGPRVFAYLSAGDIQPVIAALDRLGWPAVIHVPYPVTGAVPRNVWVAPGPVRLGPMLASLPIVICQGLNLTSAALVAGCRVLSVPYHQEQLMLAHRVASQGLGLTVRPKAGPDGIAGLLRRLDEDQAIGARAWARRRPIMVTLPRWLSRRLSRMRLHSFRRERTRMS